MERVDIDRVVAAPKEDSGERRAAEEATRQSIDTRKHRTLGDQERLEALLKDKQTAWENERRALQDDLADAAEEKDNLDRKIKRASLLNTVITSVIAGVTAIVAVGAWAYGQMQTAAEERAAEETRRIEVSEELESTDKAVKDVSASLVMYQAAQGEVNEEQAKVNMVQLLRGERLETLVEIMLSKNGAHPPKQSDELTNAECAAGLISGEQCP